MHQIVCTYITSTILSSVRHFKVFNLHLQISLNIKFDLILGDRILFFLLLQKVCNYIQDASFSLCFVRITSNGWTLVRFSITKTSRYIFFIFSVAKSSCWDPRGRCNEYGIKRSASRSSLEDLILSWRQFRSSYENLKETSKLLNIFS